MGEVAPSDRGTIAQRLDGLIRARHPDGHGPSSYEDIARASREYAQRHGGPTISHQSVCNIRSGKVTNPGVDSLQALANVYGVDITYFFHRAEPAVADAATRTGRLPSAATLAARLNELFSVSQPNGRPEYSAAEVAAAVTATGAEITAGQVEALRAGARSSPTPAQLRSLADFFGVPSAYFTDDDVAARVSEDLAILRAFKDVGARQIALRAVVELDDEALSALAPMIEHLGKASRRQRM
ncbi:hypothetical protein [Streptacidiphilus sp. P02-A3a]|uniref:hypothetical protein n=1 Tax=Streptacidiphilus sp. P02-A3a TaxID=2704468 RepID=UPI0015F80A95|nr:hypothetical protein [Streptacidiphilus sp. P02-A3a]QMU70616.1 hypothetical protein GXP74_22845 [Streptacidiphilus sp. P02-A3a]